MNANVYGSGVAELEPIQRDVLAYVLAHPDARDSADGIRNWWLTGALRGIAAAEVRRALDELVRRRWISMTGREPYTSYGVERDRLGEIRTFLAAE
jgi:hypothetical protein